jgi:hypothetical protein
MKEASTLKIDDPGITARAADLRRRIKAAGLTIAEFRRRSGLTRNVVYALSKGRAIRPEERTRIDAVLPK